METFLMVKPDEFRALVDYYKGKITESTLLDKAARVAAEAKLLLEDTSTPAALKEPVVKELLMQERKLTDKLRQIPIAGGVEPPPRDDDGNLMEGLQEGLLKELIKSINMRGQAAVPEMTLKREPVTPVGIKNEPVTPAKPGTSKIPFLTAPSQKIQKTKRKLPVPTPQKHRTDRRKAKGGARTVQAKAKRKRQRGGKFDIQKWISKLGVEFHWPGYQYMGPGTKLAKRLKRGDPGINRLDRLAKQHDIDYSKAKSLADKHIADRKMVAGIDKFPGKKSLTEQIVKRIMQAKLKTKL
ncbi:unnamed protein product [Pocillopora meandrina]|uniref:Phospholipase A2-like domain-containing protein n=1 Tax=Pocillopora meandrina TaxID=46732 RepID=A0AAU9XIW2_9CNID|nr:unnamed protein product [Pocillopora meandrina]